MKENLFPEAEKALRLIIKTSTPDLKNRDQIERCVAPDCLQALLNTKYVYKAYADTGKECYHSSYNAYRATLKGRNYFKVKFREVRSVAIDRSVQVLCGMGGGLIVWLLTRLYGS